MLIFHGFFTRDLKAPPPPTLVSLYRRSPSFSHYLAFGHAPTLHHSGHLAEGVPGKNEHPGPEKMNQTAACLVLSVCMYECCVSKIKSQEEESHAIL